MALYNDTFVVGALLDDTGSRAVLAPRVSMRDRGRARSSASARRSEDPNFRVDRPRRPLRAGAIVEDLGGLFEARGPDRRHAQQHARRQRLRQPHRGQRRRADGRAVAGPRDARLGRQHDRRVRRALRDHDHARQRRRGSRSSTAAAAPGVDVLIVYGTNQARQHRPQRRRQRRVPRRHRPGVASDRRRRLITLPRRRARRGLHARRRRPRPVQRHRGRHDHRPGRRRRRDRRRHRAADPRHAATARSSSPTACPVADTENMTNGNTATLFVLGDGQNDRFEVNHNRAKLFLHGGDGNDRFLLKTFLVLQGEPGQPGRDHQPGEPLRRHGRQPLRLPAERAGLHQRRPGHRHDRRRSARRSATSSSSPTTTSPARAASSPSSGIEAVEVDGGGGPDKIYVLATGDKFETTVVGGSGDDTIHIGGDAPDARLRPAVVHLHAAGVRGPAAARARLHDDDAIAQRDHVHREHPGVARARRHAAAGPRRRAEPGGRHVDRQRLRQPPQGAVRDLRRDDHLQRGGRPGQHHGPQPLRLLLLPVRPRQGRDHRRLDGGHLRLRPLGAALAEDPAAADHRRPAAVRLQGAAQPRRVEDPRPPRRSAAATSSRAPATRSSSTTRRAARTSALCTRPRSRARRRSASASR